MSKWNTLAIEDCMDAIIDYRGKTPIKTTHGIPLVTAKIIKAGRMEEPNEFIAFDAFDVWMTRGLPLPGDVVLTTEAPLGEVAQLDERKVALAQRIITLRGKSGLLDNTYLKYVLQGDYVRSQLFGRASGSTVSGIKQSELRKVEIPIPPFSEQQNIARILGSLDDKIALNREMNKTLESMAQAIFKSWFIDFEPFRDGEFIESELGMIPKGWEVKPLPELIELNPRYSLKKGSEASYLDMANIPTDNARVNDVVIREFSSGSKFSNGDTLLARITPSLENGKTAFVDFLEDNEIGWGSTEFIVMKAKNPLPKEFTYFLARTDDFRNFAISNMSGTSGRQRVPNDCFEQYLMILPDVDTCKNFGKFASSIIKKMQGNDLESKTLSTLRDTLLPKLLSGEIEV